MIEGGPARDLVLRLGGQEGDKLPVAMQAGRDHWWHRALDAQSAGLSWARSDGLTQ